MAAHITTIADAVVDALNAATFSEPHASVWAERKYRPRTDFAEIETKVYVTVKQVSSKTMATHQDGRKQRDIVIEVGIQRRTSFGENDDGDALCVLCEEIEGLFIGRQLAGTTAYMISSDRAQEYHTNQADQLETFAALILLTFRITTAS